MRQKKHKDGSFQYAMLLFELLVKDASIPDAKHCIRFRFGREVSLVAGYFQITKLSANITVWTPQMVAHDPTPSHPVSRQSERTSFIARFMYSIK